MDIHRCHVTNHHVDPGASRYGASVLQAALKADQDAQKAETRPRCIEQLLDSPGGAKQSDIFVAPRVFVK